MAIARPAAAGADSPVAWRMLAALAGAELLGMSLWFSATAVTPSLAQAFALSPSESAWLTMAVQAGFVAATLLTALANLADLVNPRTLMGVGCLLGAAANASALIVGSPWALIATRLATGAALGWVYPPAMKVAAGWFRLRRGYALGMLVGALTLGKAMPHLVTALFGAEWRTPILFTSALAVAGAAVALWIVGDGPLLPAPSRFDARAVRRVFAVREVRLATAGYLGHMWELYAMWAWVAAFAAASLAAAGSSAPGRDAALVAFVAIGSGAAGCSWPAAWPTASARRAWRDWRWPPRARAAWRPPRSTAGIRRGCSRLWRCGASPSSPIRRSSRRW